MKWPEEVVRWLHDNVPGRTTKQVTELIKQQGFEEKYGIIFTEDNIKGAKNRYHIKSGTTPGFPKGRSLKYPPEMREYIRSITPGRTKNEIAKMVSEHFGIEFTYAMCKGYMARNDLRCSNDGRFLKGNVPYNKDKRMSKEQYEKCKGTMFKKGNIPANRMEVGEYTHTTDGYLIRKVKEEGSQRERFEFVHRATWEKYNGPIPKGKKIIFLDNNKDNCDISNLALVDGSELLQLSRKGFRSDEAELTKAGLLTVKLNAKVKSVKKKR